MPRNKLRKPKPPKPKPLNVSNWQMLLLMAFLACLGAWLIWNASYGEVRPLRAVRSFVLGLASLGFSAWVGYGWFCGRGSATEPVYRYSYDRQDMKRIAGKMLAWYLMACCAVVALCLALVVLAAVVLFPDLTGWGQRHAIELGVTGMFLILLGGLGIALRWQKWATRKIVASARPDAFSWREADE